MKNLTDYIVEAYEYNYNISNVPKYTSTGTDKVDIKNKTNNKTNYTVQPKNKDELMYIITSAFKIKQYDLNYIDTSKITDMSELFTNINHNFDVSKWDVSNVTNMNHIFFYCKNFDCDLSNWDVSNVTDMNSMFAFCNKFDCDLSRWDVSNVTCMYRMFFCCENFKGKGLENWDVSNVTDMASMFFRCNRLTIISWYKK